MAGFFNAIPKHGDTHVGAGKKASFSGVIYSGEDEYSYVISAENAGSIGNSVVLQFDGVLSVGDAIGNWNADNENNTISLVSGDPNIVPNDGAEILFTGGTNAGNDNINFASIGVGENLLVEPDAQAAVKIKADKTFFGTKDGQYGLLVEKIGAGVLGQDNTLISFTGVNEAITQYRDILFTTGYFSQLILTTNGNVGIGIPSPQSSLDVKGSIQFSDNNNSTKKVLLNASLVSSETTVTLSSPNLSGTLLLDTLLITSATAPTSATASGIAGEIRADSDYVYICTATDTWKRTSVTGW